MRIESREILCNDSPRLKTGFLPRITRIFTDPSPVKIRVIREIRGKKNASAYEMVGEMANRSRLMGE